MAGFRSGVFLVVVCSILSGVMSTEAAVPVAERDALIALYNSTGGPAWHDSTSWLGAAGTECAWYGVVCDVAETHVLELNLGGNNLLGAIPVELASLAALHTLDLSSNHLSGSIPSSLGSLAGLGFMSLQNNALSGPIPPALGNLANLGELFWRGTG